MEKPRNVLSYYRVKNPSDAWQLTRWWDEGRKYDLLRCISVLVVEKEQEIALDKENQARETTLAIMPDEMACASPASSTESNVSNSSIESGKIVNRLGEIKNAFWAWICRLRNASSIRIGKDRLFEAAVVLYRNLKITALEQRVNEDQQLLDKFIAEAAEIDSNANPELCVSEECREVLSGEGYVSPGLIPPNFLQPPLAAVKRRGNVKFKAEVSEPNGGCFDSQYRKRKTKQPAPKKKRFCGEEVETSLSCLLD